MSKINKLLEQYKDLGHSQQHKENVDITQKFLSIVSKKKTVGESFDQDKEKEETSCETEAPPVKEAGDSFEKALMKQKPKVYAQLKKLVGYMQTSDNKTVKRGMMAEILKLLKKEGLPVQQILKVLDVKESGSVREVSEDDMDKKVAAAILKELDSAKLNRILSLVKKLSPGAKQDMSDAFDEVEDALSSMEELALAFLEG